MRMTTGTVVAGGRIEIPGEPLPEGSQVTVLALEGDETFEAGPAEEAALVSAMAEGTRGEHISGEEVLRKLRRRD